MSADNYYFVRPCDDGKWTYTVEFMSEEEPRPVRETDPRFSDWRAAYKAAVKSELEDVCGSEYGIICDPATENMGEKPGVQHCATCTCE